MREKISTAEFNLEIFFFLKQDLSLKQASP